MSDYILGLIVLLLVAAFISLLLCRRKSVEPGIKIMLFVLYFWAIAFIETGVFGLGYYLLNR